MGGQGATVCNPCPAMFRSSLDHSGCHPSPSFYVIVVGVCLLLLLFVLCLLRCPQKEWELLKEKMDPARDARGLYEIPEEETEEYKKCLLQGEACAAARGCASYASNCFPSQSAPTGCGGRSIALFGATAYGWEEKEGEREEFSIGGKYPAMVHTPIPIRQALKMPGRPKLLTRNGANLSVCQLGCQTL